MRQKISNLNRRKFLYGLGGTLPCWNLLSCNSYGGDARELKTVDVKNVLVPQNLLKLAHSEEVQEDLNLNRMELSVLESILRDIDVQWWPSRIQPLSKQREIVNRLETQFASELEKEISVKALLRMKQLELQSQGVRAFAREDVASKLGLSRDQTAELRNLFESTEKLLKDEASKNSGGETNDHSKKRLQSEESDAVKILSSSQLKQFVALVGKRLDMSQLSRIYPFAPAFQFTDTLLNADEVQLADLSGKVVLVHFYAFQCENCIANFAHYRRWHDKLREKGAVLIGIQTPETAQESIPMQIELAAKREGFTFPVIMDLKKKNWDAWGNTMWPTVYVVDKQGYIRYWWQGELNWKGATGDRIIEKQVESLLKV